MLFPVKTATHSLRSRAKHFKNALADTIKMQISKKKNSHRAALQISGHFTCFPCTSKVVICGVIEEENFCANAAL